MKFDDNNIDFSGVDDQRDGRGGRSSRGGGVGPGQVAMAGGLAKMLGGGGVMTIIILLVFVMCSIGGETGTTGDGGALYEVPSNAQGVNVSLAQRCPQDAEDGVFEDTDCLLVKSYNEANDVWSGVFQQADRTLQTPGLTFFDGSTRTACGPADTNVGPFYCPGDERIYFDLGFNRQLAGLGVQGQYAMVYIMAHEYGHHLQNVLGIEQQVRRAQQDARNPNNYSVAMELQADCFAGVWGRLANDMGNVQITPEEFQQASNAAAAVGDDRIMEGAGVRVNPEKFTHGSAKQRQLWYTRGYDTGDINQCNTFAELGLPV